MSHLSLETIARLVDEQPSMLDNAHLESCAACREELAAMRDDVAALGQLPAIEPSPASWEQIEARLAAEGLLSTKVARPRSYMMLARAAVVGGVFVGGALLGRAMAEDAPLQQQVAQTPAVQQPLQTQNATSEPGPTTVAESTPPNTRDESPVKLASTGNRTPATGDDAELRELREAEDEYFSALKRVAQKKGTETNDPTTRLATLEGIVLTTRAALAQSPTDPVINGYYLTALAQRDAMLKQIRATSATAW